MSSDSIHFVVLPYFKAFSADEHQQTNMLRHDKSQQDLAAYNWMISVTTLAGFNNQRGQLQTPDGNQTSGGNQINSFRLVDKYVIIPIPESEAALLLPLQRANSTTIPLWIQYLKQGKVTWHSPSLTPNIAAQVLADQKKTDRLAERMADRAFYFGYDTNDDALE